MKLPFRIQFPRYHRPGKTHPTLRYGLASAALGYALLCLSAPPEASAQIAGPVAVASTDRTINVQGTAEVRVQPDEVRLLFGVESRKNTISEAANTTDEAVATVIAFLKEQGVEEKDIQTDHVGIDPMYEDRGTGQQVASYYVRRSISVRLRDTAKFEPVFRGSLEKGVTHVHGVEFHTTKLREHRDEARKLAAKAAQEKAALLAEQFGATVGRVKSISENVWGGVYHGGAGWGGGGGFRGGMMMQNTMQEAAAAPGAADQQSFALGQIEVSATLNVTFLLE